MLPRLSIAVLLVLMANVAEAKSLQVEGISMNKAARALARAHLAPGIRSFILSRLNERIATTTPGTKSALVVNRVKWGHAVTYAVGRDAGAPALVFDVPRRSATAAGGGIVVRSGERHGGSVLSRAPDHFLVDKNGVAQPTDFSTAWGYTKP
jgi:hypothetical protein